MYETCVGCDKDSHKKICNTCQFDINITMSKTEVKNKFKLSEDELDDNDYRLNYLDFHARYYSGRKYIIKNIIELMDDLIKNDIADDRQKRSFLKQKKIYDEYVEKQNQKVLNKQQIKDYLKSIIVKSNLGLEAGDEKYIEIIMDSDTELDNEINKQISKYSDNIDIISVSLELIPIAESRIKSIKRKYDFDNLIDKIFSSNKKEHNNAKLHRSYREYIYGDIQNIQDACNIIKLDFDKQRENDNEKRRLQARLRNSKNKK